MGKTPKTKWVIVTDTCCLPKLESETLFPKTPYILNIGFGKIDLQLIKKPLHCGMALILSDVAVQAAKVQEQLVV